MNYVESTGEYYTTTEAAKILRVSDAYIRQMLIAGELQGEHDSNGRWRISARAVHEKMKDRRPRESERDAPNAPIVDPFASERLNTLQERVERLQFELGRSQARAELTEKTESTLREQLERERQRADEERERAERLQQELDETRISWWRRLFR